MQKKGALIPFPFFLSSPPLSTSAAQATKIDEKEGRQGPKKLFGARPPYLSIWMTAPPLISRSGSGTGKYIEVLTYATCTSPKFHLICPPKFCITFVFHFSWVLQPSQERLKTILMQNFGGQMPNKVHYGCASGESTQISTKKLSRATGDEAAFCNSLSCSLHPC